MRPRSQIMKGKSLHVLRRETTILEAAQLVLTSTWTVLEMNSPEEILTIRFCPGNQYALELTADIQQRNLSWRYPKKIPYQVITNVIEAGAAVIMAAVCVMPLGRTSVCEGRACELVCSLLSQAKRAVWKGSTRQPDSTAALIRLDLIPNHVCFVPQLVPTPR